MGSGQSARAKLSQTLALMQAYATDPGGKNAHHWYRSMTALTMTVGSLLAALLTFAQPACAQDAGGWPNRLITLVVPYAAGGPVDTIARIFGACLSELLNQQVIIENIGGAGGMAKPTLPRCASRRARKRRHARGVFRVGRRREVLAPEFHPLPAPRLTEPSPHRAWLRRLYVEPQFARIEPPLFPSRNRRKRVVAQSRRNFGRPRSSINKFEG
jgi:hypothetical protein